LTKTPLIYSASRFNLGGLRALFGGDKPTKAPCGDGTVGTPAIEHWIPNLWTVPIREQF